MKALRHPAVYWAVALLLGAVFVYASLEKISQPKQFAKIVYRYHLLGPDARLGVVPANALAVTLPWIEEHLAEVSEVFGGDPFPYGFGFQVFDPSVDRSPV